MPDQPENYQAQFHRRWLHLSDPDVRALAWLLDAPDLLDPQAPQWQGRIASLGQVDQATQEWLAALDSAPGALHAYLGTRPYTRLGRYAEKLMAFYFQHAGTLVAHGLQVRNGKNETIGEFDFLLMQDHRLVHWEFASKFYLLESSGPEHAADYFVGPNLADTLGAKVRKIMERQLSLSLHPASQAIVPQPVAAAAALVKGWLFYYGRTPVPPLSTGVSQLHCRGFWRPLSELDAGKAGHYAILPRLSWLAPAKMTHADAMDSNLLRQALEIRFENDSMPVMVAELERSGEFLLESDRGFIVPDDWRGRAGERILRMAATG